MKPEAAAAPSPPAVAATLFADRLPLAIAYADWLVGAGVERGLLGPREVERVWERHLLNCAVIAPLLSQSTTVADIGSGAGLPGIVLAIARPDLTVVLIEPLLRRADFLREVVEALGLLQVDVVRERAEQVSRMRFPVVTARAVAPLERLVGWTLPLVEPGGELLALKGSSAAEELEDAREALTRWDVEDARVLQVGHGIVEPPTTVVRIRRGPCR